MSAQCRVRAATTTSVPHVRGARRRSALAALLLAVGPSIGVADRAGDVAVLEAKCEAQREARIKPLREAAIAQCKSAQDNTPDYCERFWKDYGNATRGANGGMIPRLFGDLPVCIAAFEARKALADGG